MFVSRMARKSKKNRRSIVSWSATLGLNGHDQGDQHENPINHEYLESLGGMLETWQRIFEKKSFKCMGLSSDQSCYMAVVILIRKRNRMYKDS